MYLFFIFLSVFFISNIGSLRLQNKYKRELRACSVNSKENIPKNAKTRPAHSLKLYSYIFLQSHK